MDKELKYIIDFCENQISSIRIDNSLGRVVDSFANGASSAYLDVILKCKQLSKDLHSNVY